MTTISAADEGRRMAERVIMDIISISAGTMATLTRDTSYATVEAIQHTWIGWALSEQDAGRTFECWQDSWHAWLESMA